MRTAATMYYLVPPQAGKRFIVTGANSGTGKEATRRLAHAGADVVMAVRSLDKGEQARADILRENPTARLHLAHLDLADLSSVHSFADQVADGQPLHALINNAGVMIPPKRMTIIDGFELQFGANYLGPFALTNLLLPALLRTPGARVATMSSGAANFGHIDFDDLQWTNRRYTPSGAYCQSKLADLLLSLHLATLAETHGWDLLSVGAHPGCTRTNLQTAGRNLTRDPSRQLRPSTFTPFPSQAPESGAEPLLHAATSPDAQQGAYYGPSRYLGSTGPTRKARIPRSARTPGQAERLWSVAETLTNTRAD